MKRVLLVTVCVLIAGATAAQAETIDVGSVVILVTADRTPYDSNYDKVVLKINGWTADNEFLTAEFAVTTITGTWREPVEQSIRREPPAIGSIGR